MFYNSAIALRKEMFMKRYFVQLPHLKSCAIGLYFHGGTCMEEKEHRGISHLLEHLMFRKMSEMKNVELYQRIIDWVRTCMDLQSTR